MLPRFDDCPVPFPQVGAIGYLRTTGAPRRILRHNADGTVVVKLLADPARGIAAPLGSTATREDELADLFATVEEATATPSYRARGRRAGRAGR